MSKVPEELDLPQDAFGIHHVVESARNLLDGHFPPGQMVVRRSEGGREGGREGEREIKWEESARASQRSATTALKQKGNRQEPPS
jgi:hypothetical protein